MLWIKCIGGSYWAQKSSTATSLLQRQTLGSLQHQTVRSILELKIKVETNRSHMEQWNAPQIKQMNHVGVEPVLQLVVINLFSTRWPGIFCFLSVEVVFLSKGQWHVSDFLPPGTIWLIRTKIRYKNNFSAKVTALNTAFEDLRTHAWKDFYFPFFPLLPLLTSTFKLTGIVTGRFYSYVFPPYQF